MTALAALCLLVAAAPGSRAHLETSVPSARIGEPIVLTVVVEHPTGATLKLPGADTLPRSFALVSDLGVRREDDPDSPGRTTTRARWCVMALEGGDAVLPAMRIQVDAGGAQESVDVELPKLEIQTALGPDEDAPRPARGFRPAPVLHGVSLRAVAIAGSAALMILVLGIVLWRRRRAVAAVLPAPSPLERLIELERRAALEPELARDATYALTALVREAVDVHTGETRAALTDDDWIAATAHDPRVPQVTRDIAARLLSAAERVKYAVETPSILAVRESFSAARLALGALGEQDKAAA